MGASGELRAEIEELKAELEKLKATVQKLVRAYNASKPKS